MLNLHIIELFTILLLLVYSKLFMALTSLPSLDLLPLTNVGFVENRDGVNMASKMQELMLK